MNFPERERRHHSDIFAGMMFCFVEGPDKEKPTFVTLDDGGVDRTKPQMVIGKEYVQKFSGGWWRYLLLGPGPDGLPHLAWFEGNLHWIKRIADPVWEERERDELQKQRKAMYERGEVVRA